MGRCLYQVAIIDGISGRDKAIKNRREER